MIWRYKNWVLSSDSVIFSNESKIAPFVDPQLTITINFFALLLILFSNSITICSSLGILFWINSNLDNLFSIMLILVSGSSVIWPISSCSSPVFQNIPFSVPNGTRIVIGSSFNSNLLKWSGKPCCLISIKLPSNNFPLSIFRFLYSNGLHVIMLLERYLSNIWITGVWKISA